MIEITDRSKEVIQEDSEFPLSLEKLVLKSEFPVRLHLVDWELDGLRIGVSVKGLGLGYFNEQPYTDREFALREYDRVVSEVRKGNYVLELYDDNHLKLTLKNPA